MIENDKVKSRRRTDRRQKQDRRNGFDRRLNNHQAKPDNHRILNTREACLYLGISRPTYLKYITSGKIKAQKIGRGWKVIKAELDRFIQAA